MRGGVEPGCTRCGSESGGESQPETKRYDEHRLDPMLREMTCIEGYEQEHHNCKMHRVRREKGLDQSGFFRQRFYKAQKTRRGKSHGQPKHRKPGGVTRGRVR